MLRRGTWLAAKRGCREWRKRPPKDNTQRLGTLFPRGPSSPPLARRLGQTPLGGAEGRLGAQPPVLGRRNPLTHAYRPLKYTIEKQFEIESAVR